MPQNVTISLFDSYSVKPGSYFLRTEFDVKLTSQPSFHRILASELPRVERLRIIHCKFVFCKHTLVLNVKLELKSGTERKF